MTTLSDSIDRFISNEVRVNTFVNQPGEYLTSDNTPVETLPSFMARVSDDLDATLQRFALPTLKGAWTAGTHYSVWDAVSNGGTWYICITAHTSSSTFSADGAHWIIYQGLTSATLFDVAPGYFATAADLRATANPATLKSVITLGAMTAGDQGGGMWRWDAASTAADNLGTVLKATGWSGPGRWLRIHDGHISVRWFGATGDGLTDDTLAIQSAIDSLPTIRASSGWSSVTAEGHVLYIPSGVYLTTNTLYIPSNTHLMGVATGSRFLFNPSVAKHFMEGRPGGASGLDGSTFSVRIKDIQVSVKTTGEPAIPGRGSSTIYPVNANAMDCFHFSNVAFSSFQNILVNDFWYGTAFYFTDGGRFSFYNQVFGCWANNCKLSFKPISGMTLTGCCVQQGVNFPPPGIASTVEYGVDLSAAAGISMSGGSIEGIFAVAAIKSNGAGHAFNGMYIECVDTPTSIDLSSASPAARSVVLGGFNFGYSTSINIDENVSSAGGYNRTLGFCLGLGDCDEIEIEDYTNGQSPSFRYGLPGSNHYPAGGDLSISDESFIDRTCIVLARSAGSGSAQNTLSYNFALKNSDKFTANIWITCLIKIVGGEDNFYIKIGNGNVHLYPYIVYKNGWKLYAAAVPRTDNSALTLYVTQLAGSVDAARKICVTGIRCYSNGFKPVPSPYRYPEYRTAAPTAGTWKVGDQVINSRPSAGAASGWVCVTAGTPGTWKAISTIAS